MIYITLYEVFDYLHFMGTILTSPNNLQFFSRMIYQQDSKVTDEMYMFIEYYDPAQKGKDYMVTEV